eukprot:TRINITY_DN16329_c0_g2_i1.p1 TRINITY_DN16329_c0_g2~~TRINITY_DN16329_c0_g2_i1.p1  ORF type:complete len:1461 (+),score=335.23 TRINITY_DN16329_c0_g2_i1:109-4491(+)
MAALLTKLRGGRRGSDKKLGGVMGRLLEANEDSFGEQTLAGVAKRAALVAQQEQARQSSDVIMKLHRIYDNLSERMLKVIERNRQRLADERHATQSRRAAPGPGFHALSSDNDPEMEMMAPLLLELKALFEEVVEGKQGIAEDEFLTTFGPAFLPGASPEQMAQWFTGIDYDADGRVGWDEFCDFLMSSKHLPKDVQDQDFLPLPMLMDTDGLAGHRECMTHILHNTINDVYISAGEDGVVRQWNPQEGVLSNLLVHGCAGETAITDMKWIKETNRLIVLQMDRTIAVYDCGMLGRARRNPLVRMYKGVEPKADRDLGHFSLGTRGKPMAQRLVEAAPDPLQQPLIQLAALREQKKGKQADEVLGELEMLFGGHVGSGHDKELQTVDAAPLDDLTQATMSMDYAHWTQGGAFLVGCEGGGVHFYTLHNRGDSTMDDGDLGRSHVHWKPHAGWVTRLQAVASLDGFISSSTDETLQVFNIEKGHAYVTMQDRTGVHNIHWGTRNNRGVYGFDYSPELNLLVSWGENRKFIIWNPLTGLSLFQRSEHTHPLTHVMFKPNHQLVSLSEDKTIKIWDTRTLRCVQTLVDKQQRLPEDRYRCMAYDRVRSTIVTGAAVPVLFRMRVVQERMEAGVSVQQQVGGHSQPVTLVMFNPRFGHIVSIDRDSIFTWDLVTGKQLSVWHPDVLQADVQTGSQEEGSKRISAACFGYCLRRLMCCSDDGNVHVFNYVKSTALKTCISGAHEELCCCMSVLTNEGMPYAEPYIIAAGLSKKLSLWKDKAYRGMASGEEQIIRPAHQMGIESYGFAYTLDFVPPARLLVGTHKGFLLMFNLNNMALVSVCSSTPNSPGSGGMKGAEMLRHAAAWSHARRGSEQHAVPTDGASVRRESQAAPQGPAGGRQGDTSADDPLADPLTAATAAFQHVPQGGGLLSRMRTIGSHVRRISGAQAFLHFKAITNQHVTGMVTALCLLSPSVLCTLHGNGELCTWRVAKEAWQAHIVSCIPASYDPGEAAGALCYAPSEQRLYVGDDRGYLSGFDIARLLSGMNREEAPRAPGGASSPVQETPQAKPQGGVVLPPIDQSSRSGAVSQQAGQQAGDGKEAFRTRARRGISRIKIVGISQSPRTDASRGGGHKEKNKNQQRAVSNEFGIHLMVCIHAHQGHVSSVASMVARAEQQTFVVTAGNDCAVKIWTAAGEPIAAFGRRGTWPEKFALAVAGEIPRADSSSAGEHRCLSDEEEYTEPQEPDPDTRECIAGHYFVSLFPHNSTLYRRRKSTTFGDVISQASKAAGEKSAAPRHTSVPSAEDPAQTQLSVQEQALSPADQPLPPAGESAVLDGAADRPDRSNLERMITYSMRRTQDPDVKKMLELQRLEAVDRHQSSWHLQEVRDRIRQRNPLTSQYSVLKVPSPDNKASVPPWQVAARRPRTDSADARPPARETIPMPAPWQPSPWPVPARAARALVDPVHR